MKEQKIWPQIFIILFLNRLINRLQSFLCAIFVVQFATSGICICTSLYSLEFLSSTTFLATMLHTFIVYFNHFHFRQIPRENVIQQLLYGVMLVYNILDILTLMYFGNEINLLSSQFSYCLFKSDWIGKSLSTKNCIIIFGDLLMRPHKMLILKIFPLTLETFTKVSAKKMGRRRCHWFDFVARFFFSIKHHEMCLAYFH